MSKSEDKLIQYLNEAHATELALVSTLRAHISMTPSSSYRALLEEHLDRPRARASASSGACPSWARAATPSWPASASSRPRWLRPSPSGRRR